MIGQNARIYLIKFVLIFFVIQLKNTWQSFCKKNLNISIKHWIWPLLKWWHQNMKCQTSAQHQEKGIQAKKMFSIWSHWFRVNLIKCYAKCPKLKHIQTDTMRQQKLYKTIERVNYIWNYNMYWFSKSSSITLFETTKVDAIIFLIGNKAVGAECRAYLELKTWRF